MRKTSDVKLRRAALGAVALLVGLPLAAQSAELAMLGGLTKGSWTVRNRGDGSQQQICVRTGRELIQLRHKQPGCRQFVVDDKPNEVVVQYTCRGSNYGRTSIRRETSSLVQVESQGIAGGLPFQFTAEARRTGACS